MAVWVEARVSTVRRSEMVNRILAEMEWTGDHLSGTGVWTGGSSLTAMESGSMIWARNTCLIALVAAADFEEELHNNIK